MASPFLVLGGNTAASAPISPMVPMTTTQPQQQQSGGGISLPSLPTSNGGMGVGNWINTNIGQPLGFAPASTVYTSTVPGGLPWQIAGNGVSPSAVTSATAPYTGSATTLSSILGAGGWGFLGGSILNGLIGGNQVTGGIGGGAGAAVGMAIGGPVGAVIGGLGGSVIGGLFGGKKPSDKTQSGGVSILDGKINTDYTSIHSMGGAKFSQENATTRDSIQNGVSGLSQWLLQNGATPKYGDKEDRDIIVQVGSRDGYKWWNEGAANPNRYGSDYKTFSSTLIDNTIDQYYIPEELKASLNKINKDDVTQWNKVMEQEKAASSATSGGSMYIPPKRKGGQSFDEFITNYRKNYNANAAK